jgi:hypothetical protein
MVARTGRTFGRSMAVLMMSAVMALIAAGPVGSAVAQDASPVASPEADALAATGLPEITITAQETIFSPSQPGALIEGWYIITLVNETDAVASANLGTLPEGQTVGDLTSVLSTSFKGQGGELPEWWSSATFAGGNVAASGETTRTLAYLTPGKWAIFSTNPAAIQSPSVFTILTPEEAESNYGIVPEASPVASPEAAGAAAPEGVTVTTPIDVSDTAITPSGDVPAPGEAIAEVTNSGEQAHELILVKSDAPADEATAATLATSFASGEELTGATVVGGVGTLSPGQTGYFVTTLEQGNYVLFSSLPDASGGLQADAGLVWAFTVE